MRSIKTNNHLKNKSDKELISLLDSGEDKALDELMKRYKNKLYNFIFQYVRDKDTAYDILQETFIRLYSKASSYKPSYKFSTWLYQIAINLCRDWSRKQKIRKLFSLDVPSSNSDNDSCMNMHNIITNDSHNVEDLADMRQQLKVLGDEINNLPHKLKTALVLFVLEGYSQEECAKLLDVTPKTIETRIYRARKILAKNMMKFF